MSKTIDKMKFLSGQIDSGEYYSSDASKIDESLGMTIAHPILSGKSLEVFTTEMKRWRDIGFLEKWQKNRLFTKIKLYFVGIEYPYVITITGLLGKDEEEENTRKEKLKSRLIGKIKSPFRFFKTFNKAGFYDIVEVLFDMIEDDVDKGKVAKKQGLEDAAAEELEEKISKAMEAARKKIAIFRQIDSGNFAVSMNVSEETINKEESINIRESIQKNSGLINEMALQEMAQADLPQNYKDANDFLKQYIASYEKRTKKEFTAAGVAGLKTTLKKTTLANEGDAEAIIKAAEAKYPKSPKSKGGVSAVDPAHIKAAKKFISAVGVENAIKAINAAKKEM